MILKEPFFSEKNIEINPHVVELRKQLKELRDILDALPAWVFFKDRENRFVRVNKSFCDAMKMTHEQLEGKSLFELYPKEQADKFWEDDKEVIKSESAKWHIIEPIESPQGKIWLDTSKIPYRNERGDILGVVGFSIDITHERNMKEKEEQYRAMYESSSDAIVTLEPPDWHFISANPAAIKMFHVRDEAEFKTLTIKDISPEKQSDGILTMEEAASIIQKTLVGGSNTVEWIHKRYQGGEFEAVATLAKVIVSGRTIIQASIRDISKQKESEKKIQEKMDELNKLNNLMIGRELKMVELKNKIQELEARLGEK
ncbi:MAG: PAS domain S-box protein [Candidatus Paceibacterota bacterium]|jgi:PAS domain S-box-containing protein